MGAHSENRPDLGKVMVIGGMGFLGYHVVKLLVERYRTESIFYVEVDITCNPELLATFEKTKPDVVIHTASPLPQVDTELSRALYDKVNVQGTRSVIKACQLNKVKALVYTSSTSVISDHTSGLFNADERWPPIRDAQQPEYYAETKAEDMVLAANRQQPYGLLTTAIRPSAIFGEGDKMIIPRLINIYKQGNAYYQLGNNDDLFDFTYVGNVAHAHLCAAEALLSAARFEPESSETRVDGEYFFITNDSPMYFWDFVRSVWVAARLPFDISRVWTLPRTVGLALALLTELFCAISGKRAVFNRQTVLFSCMTRYYNISKAKSRLGYQPLVPLQEGIRRSVAWYLESESQGDISKVGQPDCKEWHRSDISEIV